MKDKKNSNIQWNSNWEPPIAKTATILENKQTNFKDVSYESQLQIAEKPPFSISAPEVNWGTGKDWVESVVSDSVLNFKEYVKRKIYKPEGITVEQFTVALTKGAKFANTLLFRGYNINKQDSNGNTAFMLACQTFKREWIDFLLDAGADVNIMNKDNETPLMFICKNSSFEVKGKLPMAEDTSQQDAEKLREHNQARKDLAFDTFETLLRVGADLNVKSAQGVTALIYAVRRGNTDIVQRAIELGAEIKVVTKDGFNALDIAIENNYIMTSQLLFQLDENQFATLSKIQSRYPSKPKFVQFFEILYKSNIDEVHYKKDMETYMNIPQKNFNFLNKRM